MVSKFPSFVIFLCEVEGWDGVWQRLDLELILRSLVLSGALQASVMPRGLISSFSSELGSLLSWSSFSFNVQTTSMLSSTCEHGFSASKAWKKDL